MKNKYLNNILHNLGRKNSSVFLKFVYSYTLLVIIITIIIGSTAYFLTKNNYNKEIDILNNNIQDQYTKLIESQIIRKVELLETELNMMASVNSFYYSSYTSNIEIYRIYTNLKKAVTKYTDQIVNIHLYNSKQEIMISTQYGVNYLDQYKEKISNMYPWFYEAEKITHKIPIWFLPKTPDADPLDRTVISVYYSHPKSINMERYGALVIDVRYDYLEQMMSELVNENGHIMIINEKGYVVVSGHDVPYNTSISDIGIQDTSFLTKPGNGNVYQSRNYLSKDIISYSEPLDNGWRLIQLTPVTDFYAASYHMQIIISIICVCSIFVGFFISYIISIKMYMPIEKLSSMLKCKDDGYKTVNEFDLINKQISDLNLKIQEYMPMIKHNSIMKILSGTIYNIDELEERLQLINKSIFGEHFNVLLIKLEDRLMNELERKNVELLKMNLNQQIEKMSDANTILVASEIGESELAALIFSTHMDIGALLKKFIDFTVNSYGSDITISLGSWVESPLQLHMSYTSAQCAQKYRFMHPAQNVYFAETLSESMQDDLLESTINEFESALNANNELKCIEYIHNFTSLIQDNDYTYKCCHDYIVRFIMLFIDYTEKLNVAFHDESLIDFSGFSNIYEFETRFSEALNNLFLLRNDKIKDKQNVQLEAIRKYIADNLSEDLSLSALADYIHISPAYLSRTFKEVIGINLTDYVTNLRMEHAKEMLGNSLMDIQDIARKVGYFTPHYFSRKFKEHYGYSPSDYRYIVQNSK